MQARRVPHTDLRAPHIAHARTCVRLCRSSNPAAWSSAGTRNSWTCDAFLNHVHSASSSSGQHAHNPSIRYGHQQARGCGSCRPRSPDQPAPSPNWRSPSFSACNASVSTSNSVSNNRKSDTRKPSPLLAMSAPTNASSSIALGTRRSSLLRSSLSTQNATVSSTDQSAQFQQQQRRRRGQELEGVQLQAGRAELTERQQQQRQQERQQWRPQFEPQQEEQQQQEQQQQRHQTRSRRQSGWSDIKRAWFHGKPLSEVGEVILRKADTGVCDLAAVHHMMRWSRTPDEARMVLQVLEAFRSAWVATRSPAPFDPPFVARFMDMFGRTGAWEVLVEALRRPGVLGVVFSRKRLHGLMKELAGRGEVAPLESIFEAMPSAGVPPDRNTVYILLRAYVNTGQLDKAAALADRFKESGMEFKPTGDRLLRSRVLGLVNPKP